MDFFLHWICKPIVICNINQERRIKERGWKIFLTVKRTSAALGTIKHVSTGLSGDFRRLDAGRIIYIPVTSHLFVFWCWPSSHSHLQEWRIHPPLWGRQPAFLTPTVHSPGCPTSPSARQCVASWWGRVWDICGYLCCIFGKYAPPSLPSPCISFKGVSCCISSFRFDSQSLMYLTGGFHWFHRSFGKVHSNDCMQELPLRLLTFWVTDLSAVLTKLLSFFPSGWEIPPSYPRVVSFFQSTIYIPFSSSEEMYVTFSEALFSPTSGSAESKQLVTLQHVTSMMHQGAFCIQGATDAAQQPLLTQKEKRAIFLCPTTVSFLVTVLLLQQFPVFWNQAEGSERESIFYVQEVD